ncbi:MAG: peptidoglycan DD-metalloendopeptidase family protein [Desulfuromonadales bacterium]|nr:peptidoglycan DD-metalloendopeptidase family protein [Desulfuromonadales bacterium]NIS41346.1 peptidoglycan DD-metalloendopeptidase family protein [Desulfuromonadales bacterium]
MSAKKYTVLVIPEGSHRVKRLVFNRRAIKGALALALTLFAGLSLTMYDYFRTHIDSNELSRLRVENRQQHREILELGATLEDLRKDVVVLAQNDAKVRVMANMVGSQNKDQLTGVGGPSEVDPTAEISELQRKIDSLRSAIELRRESQEEVQGLLNDQRSLAAATPKGWPAKGWLTSSFGMRKSPFTGQSRMHEGLDIAARTGTPIHVTADGIVSRSQTVPGYGKLVVVDHGYGYRTYYGHNSKNYVKVGQRVKAGDKIAAVGNTGRSTGSHCHYEIRLNGVPVNPKKYL